LVCSSEFFLPKNQINFGFFIWLNIMCVINYFLSKKKWRIYFTI
jgi:hypothetical protein